MHVQPNRAASSGSAEQCARHVRPIGVVSPVRFHEFEFDVETAELRRAGAVVPLERQPAMTLGLLVARAGRLVPRDDIRDALWPDEVHVDFDGGMNYSIRQLRAAFGDSARQPRFIETVPRQGYRFIAPLIDAAPAVPPRRLRTWRVAAAAALAATVAAAVWDARFAGPESKAQHHAAAVSMARAVHRAIF